MFEVKAPVVPAGPSSVLEPAMVGDPVVFQQTPCCVGFGLPSPVMFPFPVAVVGMTLETSCVVTVGSIIGVNVPFSWSIL